MLFFVSDKNFAIFSQLMRILKPGEKKKLSNFKDLKNFKDFEDLSSILILHKRQKKNTAYSI